MECVFDRNFQSVRVVIDRCALVQQLVDEISTAFTFNRNKRRLALFFCHQRLDNLNLPIYKYGIVYDAVIQGRFENIPKKMENVIFVLDSWRMTDV